MSLFSRTLLTAAVACTFVLTASCSETGGDAARAARCDDPPAGEVNVFLTDAGSGHVRGIEGRLLDPGTKQQGKYLKHVIEEPTGTRREFTFAASGGELGLVRGRTYRFTFEYVQGFPSANALLVSGEEGLLLAAASDFSPGETVLRDGVPGFGIEMLPSECPGRADEPCYDAIRNTALRFTHDGAALTLFQGESGRLGAFDLRVLIAREVDYAEPCADAGVYNVSYVIRRGPARP